MITQKCEISLGLGHHCWYNLLTGIYYELIDDNSKY